MAPPAFVYMILLAVQFGLQAVLTQKFTHPDVNRTVVIILQELTKFMLSGVFLIASCKDITSSQLVLRTWTFKAWISNASIPAILYALQNICILKASQNLDAVSFNVLNQTKTISAALFCYVLMGKKQTLTQIIALMFLLVSSVVIEGSITLDYIRGDPF
jgi:UDP-sugar transporter A1/2/3